jgi:tRNA-Thr(GGU) m(6)t(6)A37 methyltransferase TsaA
LPEKFGVPRQSGLVDIKSKIVFEKKYRDINALRGIEDYSHLWLIWQFSHNNASEEWSPTVRPPRLGGNKRMGVFATRSPNRPNRIGLSSVRLVRLERDCPDAPVLVVSGADLVDKTPIYDIKPYLPFTDCHPDAAYGFTADTKDYSIEAYIPPPLLEMIPPDKRKTLLDILKCDPRPAYQHDPERIYGFTFAGFQIKFTVSNLSLRVTEINKC